MQQLSSNVFRTSRLMQIGLIAGSTLLLAACSGYGGSQQSAYGEAESDGYSQTKTAKAAEPAPIAAPTGVSSTTLGDVLVAGASNKTLYTFTKDTAGSSNCNGGCAGAWPPFMANSDQSLGDYTTIVRDDSTLQWAYQGSPLYFYAGDAAEGDINGEGLSGVWFVAKP